jgi:hypothetical protein
MSCGRVVPVNPVFSGLVNCVKSLPPPRAVDCVEREVFADSTLWRVRCKHCEMQTIGDIRYSDIPGDLPHYHSTEEGYIAWVVKGWEIIVDDPANWVDT